MSNITLLLKSDKNTAKKQNITLDNSTSNKHLCKNLQQNITKLNPTVYKKNYTPRPHEIYPSLYKAGSTLKTKTKTNQLM